MAKIKTIRTVRLKSYPNIIWVEVETDEGIIGTGEAFRGAASIETMIHEEIAPWVLGKDSRQIEFISRTLMEPYLGFQSTSSEVRAASAIDIALWDLFGLRHEIPVYEALGGASRTSIDVYNTCAGYSYNNKGSNYDSGRTRRIIGKQEEMNGPYDDQIAFHRDAGKLAKHLLSEGFHAMKIWPFDPFSYKTDGNYISLQDIEAGLKPFEEIRNAVGNKMEIMCELHSLWSEPAAQRICEALEEYNVFWVEDPLNKMNDIKGLKSLRNKTNVPICGSETLAGTSTFRHLLEEETLDYLMIDLGWCGGLTEGRKIAYLAESFRTPLTPHDCSGPIVLWAGIHLALHSPTGVLQEVVRANLSSWYKELVTDLPEIKDGKVELPKRAGIGTKLKDSVKKREDVLIVETR